MFRSFLRAFTTEAGGAQGETTRERAKRAVSDSDLQNWLREFARQKEQSSETYEHMVDKVRQGAAGTLDLYSVGNTYPNYTQADFEALLRLVEEQAKTLDNGPRAA